MTIRFLTRLALGALLFLAVSTTNLYAQSEEPDTETDVDTVWVDDDYDSEDYYDESYDMESDTDGDYQYDNSDYTNQSGVKNFGGFIGPSFSLADIDMSGLDPDLAGDVVMFGGYGYAILGSWLLGGGGAGATVYNLSPKYDHFSFEYGGFLTGYEYRITDLLTAQATALSGQGGYSMIKKRGDLSDSTGNDLLERFRDGTFFFFKPTVSIGLWMPSGIDFRLFATYFYPVGGHGVGDLKHVGYGVDIMFGFRYP